MIDFDVCCADCGRVLSTHRGVREDRPRAWALSKESRVCPNGCGRQDLLEPEDGCCAPRIRGASSLKTKACEESTHTCDNKLGRCCCGRTVSDQ